MAQPGTQLGGRAVTHPHHTSAPSTDAESDRLRALARHEAAQRHSSLERAHAAYARGDGATAHALSTAGKQHGARADALNRQASAHVFRANNAPGRVAADAIDLHGQFVEEAAGMLETKIAGARARGERCLHVIVGKGNHSADHVQRLKPAVERICRELGLSYATEANAGRLYVDLTGAPVHAVPPLGSGHAGAHPPSSQPHRPHGPPPQHAMEVEEPRRDGGLVGVLRALKGCCIVM